MTGSGLESLQELVERLEVANAKMDKALEGMRAKRLQADAELREQMLEHAPQERDRKVREEMERLGTGEITPREFMDGPAGERLYDRNGEQVRQAFKDASEVSDEEFREAVVREGLEEEFPWAVDDGRQTDDEEPGYDDRLRQADRFKKPE